ncbi:hypothetical protein BHE74_00037955 [Ensete ventricosum]|nr:hypothetical protein GW17_00019255 [Ensete ventricosum]RWW55410.1 hypothetical protein BHE74_00037955 [Ensete ventricosum]RZR85634.1 hypothetical protein BHM03_00012652 [Ensete ventricosum]
MTFSGIDLKEVSSPESPPKIDRALLLVIFGSPWRHRQLRTASDFLGIAMAAGRTELAGEWRRWYPRGVDKHMGEESAAGAVPLRSPFAEREGPERSRADHRAAEHEADFS